MTATAPTPQADGAPDAAAAYWDARLRNPECSGAERARFEAWRAADPAHALAFERLQTALEALRGAASRPTLRAIRDKALSHARRTQTVAAIAGVAAIFVLGVLVAPRALAPAPSEHTPSVQRTAPEPILAYATEIGERKTLVLKDGSTVTLDTQSRLQVRFTDHRRTITLVAGQAHFQVHRDPERPFVVTAGDRTVTAIGTQFDVRVDRGDVRVVLVEGRVAVEKRPVSGFVARLLPERRELSAGEEFLGSNGGASLVRNTDVNRATLWREGRVVFEDTPLPDAIAEMNRYSLRAVVADPSMAQLRVNGVFHTDHTDTFLQALEEYFPIEQRRQPDGDTLLVWRD